jgi:hypothetical protein
MSAGCGIFPVIFLRLYCSGGPGALLTSFRRLLCPPHQRLSPDSLPHQRLSSDSPTPETLVRLFHTRDSCQTLPHQRFLSDSPTPEILVRLSHNSALPHAVGQLGLRSQPYVCLRVISDSQPHDLNRSLPHRMSSDEPTREVPS